MGPRINSTNLARDLAFWMATALLCLWGCFDIGPYPPPPDDQPTDGSEGEGEGETDSDSSADTESTTGEGEGECDECPENSGYPCPCSVATCDDGSVCDRQGLRGTCRKDCVTDEDCAWDADCLAQGQCVFVDMDSNSYCGLVCAKDSECPTGMFCRPFDGFGFCDTAPCELDPEKKQCPDPCPLNRGFPCACQGETCDDGSICLRFSDDDSFGICGRGCETHSDCEQTDLSCDAVPFCIQESGGRNYCIYFCCQDEDCPAGMGCGSPWGYPMCWYRETDTE